MQNKNVRQQLWWALKAPLVYKNPWWYLFRAYGIQVRFWQGGDLFVRGHDDATVVNEIFLGGIYDYALLHVQPRRVLDIGGHIGCFSLRAHQLGATSIDTYEPHPDNYRLCTTLIGSFATVFHRAISNKKKLARLYFGSNSGEHSLHGTGASTLVRCVPLPNKPYDLIKIDAEGEEYTILRTARLPPACTLIVETTDVRLIPLLHRKGFKTDIQNLDHLGLLQHAVITAWRGRDTL